MHTHTIPGDMRSTADGRTAGAGRMRRSQSRADARQADRQSAKGQRQRELYVISRMSTEVCIKYTGNMCVQARVSFRHILHLYVCARQRSSHTHTCTHTPQHTHTAVGPGTMDARKCICYIDDMAHRKYARSEVGNDIYFCRSWFRGGGGWGAGEAVLKRECEI